MTTFTGLSSITGLVSMSFGTQVVDQVVFSTTLSSGIFGESSTEKVANVTTTTGRCKVTWWDGVSTIHSSSDALPQNPIQIQKTVSSPYNNSSAKTATIVSCDASGNASGYINVFGLGSNNKLQSVDASSCSQMTLLSIGGGAGSGVTVSTLGIPPNIEQLVISDQPLGGSLDLSDYTSLTGVVLVQCSLTGLIVDGLTNITNLSAEVNNFTSIDVSSLSSLQNLNLRAGALTSIDLSGLSNLYSCYLQDNNNLTSVRAVGVGGGMGFPYYYSATYLPSGINVAYCSLGASALNQLYSDLSSTTGAVLLIRDNPGLSTDDPSIATAKGYTIIDV